MARELNERQQKFLEVLFEEAGGDVVAAKKLAGYSENYCYNCNCKRSQRRDTGSNADVHGT